MFLKFTPELMNNGFVKLINKFYKSKIYIILIGVLVALSAIFGLELFTYGFTLIVCALIPALFCEDMTSTVVPLMMYYCTFSFKHNNTLEHRSCFNDPAFMGRFVPIAVAIGFILVTRFVFDLVTNKERRHYFPRLTIGFGVLALTYMLAGIGSSYYEFKSTLFGLLEVVSLCATYFYLIYSIDWKKFKVDYIFFALIVFGLVLVVELIGAYIMNAPIVVDGDTKKYVITGWGISTNVSSMLSLTVCAPFYFICKNKKPILNSLVSMVLLVGLFFAQARGPFVIATFFYIACVVISLIKSNKKTKIKTAISIGGAIILVGVMMVIFRNFIYEKTKPYLESFNPFTDAEFFLNNRLQVYKDGISFFLKHPLNGTGWFSCTGKPRTIVFVPSRWHDTFIQTLATGGLIMTLGYLFHRFETIVLLFKNNKKIPLSTFFLFVPIVILLISSLFDCFIFNLGPGLIYGILLATIEKSNSEEQTLF